MSKLAITIVLGLAVASCAKMEEAVSASKEETVDPSRIQPMLGAVMHSQTEEVRRLAEQHVGLDERLPDDQSTPMIAAAQTDQWPMVEILLDHGADIWAHDQFGITAAQRTVTSRIFRGSAEDAARLRVMEKQGARLSLPAARPCRDARPRPGRQLAAAWRATVTSGFDVSPLNWPTLLLAVLLSACAQPHTAKDDAVDPSKIQPMLGAVMHSETVEVRRLAEQGIGLNERYPANQSTPMIMASSSDQWPVVEILVDHGADIWAHDQFGITMAQMAVTSRILPGSKEDAARLRVIEKLKARGYPFPPPGRAEVLALDQAGNWPPHGVRH